MSRGAEGGAPPPRLVPGGGFAFLRFRPQKRSRGAIASRGITRGERRLLGTLRWGGVEGKSKLPGMVINLFAFLRVYF